MKEKQAAVLGLTQTLTTLFLFLFSLHFISVVLRLFAFLAHVCTKSTLSDGMALAVQHFSRSLIIR